MNVMLTMTTSECDALISTMVENRGGVREGAGRKSAYPGKVVAFSMDFTTAGRRALDAITARAQLSRNDVLTHLVLKYGPQLDLDGDGVAFPGKAQVVLTIRVPRTAARVLDAARRRTGKSYSDIGEALVWRHGVQFDEAQYPPRPEGEPRRRRRRVRKDPQQ